MSHPRRILSLLSLVGMLALVAACTADATAAPGAGAAPAAVAAIGVGASPSLAVSGLSPLAGASHIVAANGAVLAQQGIGVSGRGAVTAQPDIAVLTVGVEARADTVDLARGQAADAMSATIESLRANGVAERDIQTTSFSINPQYTYREVVDARGRYNEQVLVGYQVSNQASATIRDLDTVGAVIDRAAEAGGNLVRIRGIRFTIDDPAPLHIMAREAAVKQAMATAAQFAEITGVTLGRLVYITELSASPVARATDARMEMALASPAVATPISAGELEVQVTVQAVFSIL